MSSLGRKVVGKSTLSQRELGGLLGGGGKVGATLRKGYTVCFPCFVGGLRLFREEFCACVLVFACCGF